MRIAILLLWAVSAALSRWIAKDLSLWQWIGVILTGSISITTVGWMLDDFRDKYRLRWPLQKRDAP